MSNRFGTWWTGIRLAGWLVFGTAAWAGPVVHYLTPGGAGDKNGSS